MTDIAQDLEFSVEDCERLLSPPLIKKLKYSVELLRKAEKIALAYDPENGFYLAFSGGKDSQVLYHVAKIAGVRFKSHMNLTSIDPAPVIRFVKHQYPDTERVKPKESIFSLAVKKQLLPSMNIRWCCAEYKENAGAGKVTLIGIRHEESVKRAKRNEVEISTRKFSGTLEELDVYRKTHAHKKLIRKASSINITNASGEKTLGCISGRESLLISPIIHWTEKDVWEFLNTLHIPHCEVYDHGKTRVGCLCCPMSTRSQKLLDIENYPHIKRNWIKAIKAIRRGGGCGNASISPRTGQKRIFKQNEPWLMDRGFSNCSSSDGLSEEQKNEIAENIFDWWISGKPYKKWYAEKFMSPELDFKNDDNTTSI